MFVNEQVTGDDLEHPLFKMASPFYPHARITPYWWTVDKDRGFIFKMVASNNRDEPNRFIFYWKGSLGAGTAGKSWRSVDNDKRFVEYTWQIEVVCIPELLKDCEGEIKETLTAAVEAYIDDYGRMYHGRRESALVDWSRASFVIGGTGYVRI